MTAEAESAAMWADWGDRGSTNGFHGLHGEGGFVDKSDRDHGESERQQDAGRIEFQHGYVTEDEGTEGAEVAKSSR